MGLIIKHPAASQVTKVMDTPVTRKRRVTSAPSEETTFRRHTWRDRTLVKTHIVAMIIGAVLWSQMTTHHAEPKASAETPTSLAGKAPAASQGQP